MPNHDYSGRIITRRQCTPLQLNTRRHPTPRLFRTLLDCNSDRYTPVLVAASLHNVPNALRSAPRIHINSDRRHTPHISPPFHSKPQHCHPFLDAAPIQTVPRLHRNSLHGQPGHNNTRRHSKALHATTTAQHGTTDLAATSEQTYSVLVATPPLSTTDLAVTPDQLYSWRFSPSLQTTTIQVGSCRHCSPRRATSNQSSQSGPDHHTTILDSTPLHGTSRRHTA